MIEFNKKTALEFRNFALVGLVSTGVNYGIFFILVHFFKVHYIFSSSFGFLAGIFISYGLNRMFTFYTSNERTNREFVRYALICMFSLVANLTALWIFVEILGINPFLANILAIGVSTVTNFVGIKIFVFTKR